MVDAAVDFLGLHGVDAVGVAGFEEPEDIARPWRQLGLDETVGTAGNGESIAGGGTLALKGDAPADVIEDVTKAGHFSPSEAPRGL